MKVEELIELLKKQVELNSFNDYYTSGNIDGSAVTELIEALTEALAQADMLAAALEEASETIHSEFCGSGSHHPVCNLPRETLDKFKAWKDGK